MKNARKILEPFSSMMIKRDWQTTNILFMSSTSFTITRCISSLKIDFTAKSKTFKNINLTFVWCMSLKKERKKKQLKCWTIILDMLNYISICHCNNLQTNIVHPNLNLFSLEPTTRPSPILKFSFCSSLTTSHYVIPIHTRTRRGSWGFIKTKSPFLKSLNGVYTQKTSKFFGPQ